LHDWSALMHGNYLLATWNYLFANWKFGSLVAEYQSLFHPRGKHQKPGPNASMFCSTKAPNADGSLVAKPCSFPAGVTNITAIATGIAAGGCDFLWKAIRGHHYR
jgi:hypothetical protein